MSNGNRNGSESISGTSPRFGALLESPHASPSSSSSPSSQLNGHQLELSELEEQTPPDCLVLLHIASCGKQGAETGSDEKPVAMLTAKIFDLHSQAISGPEWQLNTKGLKVDSGAENSALSGNAMDASFAEDAEISQECNLFTGLCNNDQINAPSLWEAMESLDAWLRSQGLCYTSESPESSKLPRKCRFEVVVDGGAGLRLVLHQSLTHSVGKTQARFPYLCRFIDVKKAFLMQYPKTQSDLTLTGMMKELDILPPDLPPGFTFEPAVWMNTTMNSFGSGNSLTESNESSQTPQEEEEEGKDEQFQTQELGYWPVVYCRCLAKLCAKMTADGAEWKLFETINVNYVPTFVKSTEEIPEHVAIRARGLPWQTTDAEVQHFFRGLNIAPGGVALVLSKAGRRNGEAVIRFTSREQRNLALRKHKHHINQRYIEIYFAASAEFIAVAGGDTEEAESYLSKITTHEQSLIRMRGLPYTVTAEEIIGFFAKTECQVQFGREGILFVNRKDGRATGDAFVLFATDAEADKALKNHRQHIGNRYIELFRSTPAEVNQVMNVVLKQPVEVLPPIWSSPYEQEPCLSQTGALLDLHNPPLFPNGAKNLLLPSPTFTMPLLNMSPLMLPSPNHLAGLLPTSPSLSMPNGVRLLRIKGMPPGSTVNDILNFLGVYWQAVALHGVHLTYSASGEPTDEAFVRFVSEQAVELVIASKQGHLMTNAASGAQAPVQLSQASSADLCDFVRIPGSQPTSVFSWSTSSTPLATFSTPLSPSFPLFPGATALRSPLMMQLRALVPFAGNAEVAASCVNAATTINGMASSLVPAVPGVNGFMGCEGRQKVGLTISTPQGTNGAALSIDTEFRHQTSIAAGSST